MITSYSTLDSYVLTDFSTALDNLIELMPKICNGRIEGWIVSNSMTIVVGLHSVSGNIQ